MTFKPFHPRTLAAAALAAGALTLLTPAYAQQGPAAALNAQDRQFVLDASQVITTAQLAAELAGQKAESAEVRDLARSLVQDHGRANAELRQAAGAAGATLAQEQSFDQRHHLSHLASLPDTAFEREYVVHLLHDHSRAVAAYERQAQSGGNPALRAFAQQNLPVLRERLRLVQELAAERGVLDQNKLAPVQG
ncbi:MAG TPA: DUF4142 domain-containing protein [Thermoanaerobaculia bacterium]|nr:DUF4142 domain-containing protein [Thermoanaerobaculia bacterium]